MKNSSLTRPITAAAVAASLCLAPAAARAGDAARFLKPKAWHCTFSASLDRDVDKAVGAAGNSPMERLLGSFGRKAARPTGDTDSYHEAVEQKIEGKVRLHHVYDGGDGIQIAGWANGGATVHHKFHSVGTEQNKSITRERTVTYDGPARFGGEEYEPSFQIWIDPSSRLYRIEYGLEPVTGKMVEHCRMAEGMEKGRKKMEHANDAQMPAGGLFAGLIQMSCATEKVGNVQIENGAFAAMRANIPLPSSGLKLAGYGESEYTDGKGVMFEWSCSPE